jgi:Uma2 family endonuclease
LEAQAKKYYTVEEYLEIEASTEYRNEYYDGDIFAMAGASYNHNIIVENLYLALGNHLKGKKCRPHMIDMRLWIKRKRVYVYPDIMIVCGEPEIVNHKITEAGDSITNPTVIIEVLSESTKDFDHGGKFLLYRSIESLKDYILVDQIEVHIEHFYKTSKNEWVLHDYNDVNQSLEISSINFQMSLTGIYTELK